MSRPTVFTLALIVLFLAPLPALAQEPEVLDESWYVMSLLGKPAGYLHDVTKRTKLDGRTVFHTWSEQKMGVGGNVQETVSESWETEDGMFLRSRQVERDGEQEQRLDAELVGETIRVRRELNGTPRETTVAIPPGTKVYSGIGGHVLVLLGLEVGKKHEVTSFSELSGELSTETAEIQGRQTVESLGEKIDAFVVKGTSSDMPGVTMTALCDGEGSLVRMNAGPVEMVRATREEALAAIEGGGFGESLTWLPLEGGIAAWSTLDAAVVTATIKGAEKDEAPVFPDDEYHTVTGSAGQYRLDLHALPAPEKAVERLPITPRPEMKRYAEPALLVQSDAPEIRAEAARIVGDDTDPLSAAKKLCRAVFVKLKKEKAAAATASALETLQAGAGDCTEHAVLFCALARAVGLPARDVYGVTIRTKAAGYHAWSEVLIDGRWVPVDATVDAVGLPPAYIRLGVSDGNGTGPAELTAIARLLGRTELAMTSATRGGTTFDPRDLSALTRRDGDVWRDLGSDLTVDLSDGLQLRSAKPPNTIFRSPDGQVIAVTVTEGVVRLDEDWAEFERGLASSLGASLKLLDKREEGDRQLRTYTYTMNRNGQAYAGRLRVTAAATILYSVQAVAKEDLASPEDLEKLVARVKIGDR